MERDESIANARKRLIGTWRSDRGRTMENWVFPNRLAAGKLRFFESIFGKNTWRFTRHLCFGAFEDATWRVRYEILWASEQSVVVLFKAKAGESCHHLFFDEEFFYFSAGGAGNVEYFKRVQA
jgi:hypothetical protein